MASVTFTRLALHPAYQPGRRPTRNPPPSRRANLPVACLVAPCTWLLGRRVLATRSLGTARLASRLLHRSLRRPSTLAPFPPNVGTPTCPALWLRLLRLSLSTLFPEKPLRPPLWSTPPSFRSHDEPHTALGLGIVSA